MSQIFFDTQAQTKLCDRSTPLDWEHISPAGKRLRKYTRNYVLHSVTGVITIPRKIVPPKREDVFRENSAVLISAR